VDTRVNNKCDLFIEMHSLFRGQGRETSQRVFTKLRKTQNYAKFLLTTPQKYDIISISRIIDPRIALALRFCTNASLWHFALALFGAGHRFMQSALFMRGLVVIGQKFAWSL